MFEKNKCGPKYTFEAFFLSKGSGYQLAASSSAAGGCKKAGPSSSSLHINDIALPRTGRARGGRMVAADDDPYDQQRPHYSLLR